MSTKMHCACNKWGSTDGPKLPKGWTVEYVRHPAIGKDMPYAVSHYTALKKRSINRATLLNVDARASHRILVISTEEMVASKSNTRGCGVLYKISRVNRRMRLTIMVPLFYMLEIKCAWKIADVWGEETTTYTLADGTKTTCHQLKDHGDHKGIINPEELEDMPFIWRHEVRDPVQLLMFLSLNAKSSKAALHEQAMHDVRERYKSDGYVEDEE